jgi:hypothetical protein
LKELDLTHKNHQQLAERPVITDMREFVLLGLFCATNNTARGKGM